MVTLQDVHLLNVTYDRPYATAELTIFVQEFPENYKYSSFQRHFRENGWSYRREILHTNWEDHAKWLVSKLFLFY